MSAGDVFDDVQTGFWGRQIIRAIDPDSKGEMGRVPGSQGTWGSLHFENLEARTSFRP